MPHFFLHLRNAHVEASDEEGIDLPNLDSARTHAIESIRDFIGHEALKGELDLRGQIDIADDDGEIVTTVRFPEAFTIHGL